LELHIITHICARLYTLTIQNCLHIQAGVHTNASTHIDTHEIVHNTRTQTFKKTQAYALIYLTCIRNAYEKKETHSNVRPYRHMQSRLTPPPTHTHRYTYVTSGLFQQYKPASTLTRTASPNNLTTNCTSPVYIQLDTSSQSHLGPQPHTSHTHQHTFHPQHTPNPHRPLIDMAQARPHCSHTHQLHLVVLITMPLSR